MVWPRHEGQRRDTAEAVVGPFFVVGPQPVVGHGADLLQRFEDVGAQHFLAIAAVEPLDVGVLVGPAGPLSSRTELGRP